MNNKVFSGLRRMLDEVITYADFDRARVLIEKGLCLAHKKELPAEIMYFKAQGEIIKENFYQAIHFLDKAIEYNPEDGAAYNDRALCMIELGIIAEAFYYFDRGIEVEPDYATIYHNKGWLLNKTGRHQESLHYFEKALELEPGRAVTYENMADAYRQMGRIEDALEAYKRALCLLKGSHDDIKEQIKERIKELGNSNVRHME